MKTTEPLTIQVPPTVAQADREEDEQKQLKLKLLLEFHLDSVQDDGRSLQEIMRDISREAIARGMTPEILESILNDEE